MIAWIASKLAGRAISAVFAPYILGAIIIAVSAAFGFVIYYVYTAEVAKGQVAVLELDNSRLYDANVVAAFENSALNARIKAANTAKLEAIAEAAERLRVAQDAAAVVAEQKAVIADELAMANFTILEHMRDDETYLDWAYGSVHPAVWLQIVAAKTDLPAE